jgi:entericidin A
MKKMIALAVAAAMLLLAGCNTVNGFGKDVQKVGEKMENAAKK